MLTQTTKIKLRGLTIYKTTLAQFKKFKLLQLNFYIENIIIVYLVSIVNFCVMLQFGRFTNISSKKKSY